MLGGKTRAMVRCSDDKLASMVPIENARVFFSNSVPMPTICTVMRTTHWRPDGLIESRLLPVIAAITYVRSRQLADRLPPVPRSFLLPFDALGNGPLVRHTITARQPVEFEAEFAGHRSGSELEGKYCR